MTFTVEDGTGLVAANSFLSVADYKAWADLRGHDYSAYSDAEIEQALVRASDYLSEGFSWRGQRRKERGNAAGRQGLAFPRLDLADDNGYAVSFTEVPIEIEKATAEIAKAELGTPNIMQPVFTPNARVKRERFGPIEFEYDLSQPGAQAARPTLLAVLDLVGQFINYAAGSSMVAEARR